MLSNPQKGEEARKGDEKAKQSSQLPSSMTANAQIHPSPAGPFPGNKVYRKERNRVQHLTGHLRATREWECISIGATHRSHLGQTGEPNYPGPEIPGSQEHSAPEQSRSHTQHAQSYNRPLDFPQMSEECPGLNSPRPQHLPPGNTASPKQTQHLPSAIPNIPAACLPSS